jgi:hypothetical protein
VKTVSVRETMRRVKVTKAAVYRRLHGVITGRHGVRASHRPAWTTQGAYFEDGRWHIPEKLVRQWEKEKT